MNVVILGRDGVLNKVDASSVDSPESWQAIPGSLESITRLNHADIRVAVVSNQPGLANGELDLDMLNAIHHKLQRQLTRVGGHVDGIFFCPHNGETACGCHMPEPGLLEQIMQRFDISSDECTLVAGSRAEIEAATHCDIRAMLVRTGHGLDAKHQPPGQVEVFDSLTQAVEAILFEVKT